MRVAQDCAVVRRKSRVLKKQSNSVELVSLQRIVSNLAVLFNCFLACLIISFVLSYSISVIVVYVFTNIIAFRDMAERNSNRKS